MMVWNEVPEVKQTGGFVIQEHTTPSGVHWDLMLEAEGCLETFRLPVHSLELTAGPVRAVKIFDHSLRFLTYEGPVNEGAGKVRIVERGTYRHAAPRPGGRILTLEGGQLKAAFSLSYIEGDQWRLDAQK